MNSSHPKSDSNNQGHHASSFDLLSLYFSLREKGWWLIPCIILTVAAGWFYTQRAERIYAASVVLEVEQREDTILKIEKVAQDELRGQEVLNTIAQNLKNPVLFQRVIVTNGLATNQLFYASASTNQATDDHLAKQLGRMVEVKVRRGTRLIDLTVSHTNAQLAATLANSLVSEFLLMKFEQNVAASQGANTFLTTELERLKGEVQRTEQEVQDYRREKNSVSLEERMDIIIPQLRDYSLRVTQAEATRIKLESEFEQVKEAGEDAAKLLVLPIVTYDPSVVEAKTAIALVEKEFAVLKQRYKHKHPKYIQTQQQLADARNNFSNTVLRVQSTVAASLESARSAEAGLKLALKQVEKMAMDLNEQLIQYNVLAREVDASRALFEQVLTRLKETSVTTEMRSDNVVVVQPAFVPERPVWPDRNKILAASVAAGLFLGFLLIAGSNVMDTSIKTVDQAEEYLGLPVMSAIPQIKESKGEKRTVVVAEDSKSAAAEAFRTLRTSLSMLGQDKDRRTFLFTSALPQEGKTFCSINYAASLAQQGLKTLLIDGDLRRPSVEVGLIGHRSGKPGVTDCLIGKQKLVDITIPSEQEMLYYLPAGTTAPNPSELLSTDGFDNLIDDALQHFDRIVVDSAPIHAVSDTLLMLDRIQTVCVVARASKTPRKAIFRAIQLLHNAGASLGGVIMNRVPRRRGRGYYYDPYYDYSYYGKYVETKS